MRSLRRPPSLARLRRQHHFHPCRSNTKNAPGQLATRTRRRLVWSGRMEVAVVKTVEMAELVAGARAECNTLGRLEERILHEASQLAGAGAFSNEMQRALELA